MQDRHLHSHHCILSQCQRPFSCICTNSAVISPSVSVFTTAISALQWLRSLPAQLVRLAGWTLQIKFYCAACDDVTTSDSASLLWISEIASTLNYQTGLHFIITLDDKHFSWDEVTCLQVKQCSSMGDSPTVVTMSHWTECACMRWDRVLLCVFWASF